MEQSVGPFALLPPAVFDTIFAHIGSIALYNCSLVCRAWRHLPHSQLRRLSLGGPSLPRIPLPQLPLCRHLQEVSATSTTEPRWHELRELLAAQQLPTLRHLRILHSTNLSSTDLQQLQRILQAQPGSVSLQLAVTDASSLQALLAVLPWPGLTHLDLNTPHASTSALELLVEASRRQLAAATAAASPPTLQQHHQQQQQQQGGFSVGLWVCCWGGCRGLKLQDAAALHQHLQSLGCRLTGCESINCSSAEDVAALAQLRGLTALGFNYNTAQQQQQQSNAEQHASALAAALAALGSSLQQLTLQGCPPCGFSSEYDSSRAAGAGGSLGSVAAQLAQLTALTKLALTKQWMPRPLPLAPLAALTQLRELALERRALSHRSELACLGALRSLRVLSLQLSVTVSELRAQQQQQQQQEEEQEVQPAGGDPVAAACSCCCSGDQQHQLAADAADCWSLLRGCSISRSLGRRQPLSQLLDWSWLRGLQQLEMAWLQVPTLDLACLPARLTELLVASSDTHDLTETALTCGGDAGGGGCWLPNLRQLVLPRCLLPEPAAAGDNAHGLAALALGDGSSSDQDDDDDSDSVAAEELAEELLRLHHNAGLLLALAAGCPELQEMELVQWQLPVGVLQAAVRQLPYLRLLSVLGPDDAAAAEQLKRVVAAAAAAAAGRGLRLVLQQRLVLSRYPWSSVVEAR